ncbi:hypothetical protein CROQUDRAFT_669206 [Cronartium quercuum f. sp. fusiforme G11]|uniref:Uncharacterized protein n=1 Tax=Cronartium quercuum f. sp. fusiforme G11 TaxID=708437 RepID=A0A9P6NU08_9BASI|nr:hypothetical protein CROQUDRAFT_669206 [Cronartium quercuum f. sp. fusiforme G11]
MPNLRTLSLSILPIGQSHGGYGGGLSGLGFSLDGLEGELLSSICWLSSLTSLMLRQAIDFSELEVLLPCLPELKELRLQGGFQNIDGQTHVNPDAVHSCKLKHFILYLASTNLISSAQLDWILSLSAGTIVELDMVFWTRPDVNGMWGGMMVKGGRDNVQTRWVSKTLADLLIKLGPMLHVLVIRGCSFAGVTDPSLLAEPHCGSFDYALSFCHQLRHLAINWSVTGPDLLHLITTGPSPDPESDADLASPSPASPTTEITPASTSNQTITTELQAEPIGSPIGMHLKTLTLFGRPQHTSAKMMV